MLNMPGGPELMVIMLVALIVLGPEQLPKAMRTLGTVMAEIRKVSSGFQAEMKSAMDTFNTEVDKASKPHSAQMGDAETTASAPAASDVTEVVARNGSTESDSTATTAEAAPQATPQAPRTSPADRAAG